MSTGKSTTLDMFAVASALENARDHIVIGHADKINRDYHIKCARENVRDAMELLGIKEART
jgi:hypothetical protein